MTKQHFGNEACPRKLANALQKCYADIKTADLLFISCLCMLYFCEVFTVCRDPKHTHAKKINVQMLSPLCKLNRNNTE